MDTVGLELISRDGPKPRPPPHLRRHLV